MCIWTYFGSFCKNAVEILKIKLPKLYLIDYHAKPEFNVEKIKMCLLSFLTVL